MTVSYKKSGKDGGSYYTNQSSEVDDYYTQGDKEPPGVWYVAPNSFGERKTALGIQDGQSFGGSDTKKFAVLTDGFHPETGENLVQNAGKSGRVAIHDFTLSPPKSVSVVWSQANGVLKEKIEDIQSSASKRFLDYIGQKALTRLGHKGVSHVNGMVRGAMFEHGSSREGDPQLHTHGVLMSVVELEDGKTGALEARDMLRWQGAAASLYHADLAYKLREEGFGISKDKNLFEISGVPEQVRDAFSQRRKQILEAVEKKMKERGLDPAAASRAVFQIAAIDSRKKKDELTRAELELIWRERAEVLGFTEKEVKELISHDDRLYLTDEECKKEVKGVVDQIMQTKAVFGEPELVAKSASAMIGKASREQILSAVEEYKRELLVCHGEHERETMYTSREMVALEFEMLELAEDRNGRHKLDKFHLPETLSDEQRKAALGVLQDDNYVTVVEGAAGAGKTYTMASVARAYEENGYKVQGLATAWTAAQNLESDADLERGSAITGWLNSVRKGETKIDEKTLLILDESGTVSARQMRDVLQESRSRGAKVVLLGDTKQQKSVEAGSALGPIAERLGSHRLDEIRRQHRVDERAAIKDLFDGKGEEGVAVFARNPGGLTVSENDEEVNKALIKDWAESRLRGMGDTVNYSRDGKEFASRIIGQDDKFWTVTDGEQVHQIDRSHLILATDNRSVHQLNLMAQAKLKEAGQLGESRTLNTMDGELDFHEGDEIQFRANAAEHGVFNRTRGRIESFDGDQMRVRITKGDKSRIVDVNLNDPAWRSEDGELSIQLAYATTVYSSQGLTVGNTFVKDGWSLARDAAGVAASRHRENVRFYANRQDHYDRTMRKTLAENWRPISEFSDQEVQASMAKSWSRANEKETTLNHLWQTNDGAIVDRRHVLAAQKAIAKAQANSQADRKLKPLDEVKEASDKQLTEAAQALLQKGYHPKAISAARRQGVLRVDPKSGEPVLCGRNADGEVMQILPFKGRDDRSSKNDLRGRHPPILRGDSDKTLVVEDGAQALQTMSAYIELNEPMPNIIVTGGKNFALKGPLAKDMLTSKKSAAAAPESSKTASDKRKASDQSAQVREREDKAAGSTTKAREAAAAKAAAEASSRNSAASLKAQAELAKQADKAKGLGKS